MGTPHTEGSMARYTDCQRQAPPSVTSQILAQTRQQTSLDDWSGWQLGVPLYQGVTHYDDSLLFSGSLA